MATKSIDPVGISRNPPKADVCHDSMGFLRTTTDHDHHDHPRLPTALHSSCASDHRIDWEASYLKRFGARRITAQAGLGDKWVLTGGYRGDDSMGIEEFVMVNHHSEKVNHPSRGIEEDADIHMAQA